MFNIPYVYRDGYNGGDPLPVFGSAKAILWVDSLKEVYNGLPYTAATNGNTDIRLWKDQSGYNNDLTASTSNSPTYSASSFSPLGSSSSFPYIRFTDANSEYLKRGLSTSVSNISTGFTIFIVFRKNPQRNWTSGSAIFYYTSNWSANSDGIGIAADSSPTEIRCQYINAGGTPVITYINPWDPSVDEKFNYFTYRMSAHTSNGHCRTYIGDTIDNTTNLSGTFDDQKVKPPSSLGILSIAGGFNNGIFAQGTPIDVAEVILYDGAIPDDGLTTVWNYFKQKYGFTT